MVQRQTPSSPTPLLGLDRERLAGLCEGLGLKSFQVAECYRWIYARRETNPLKWTHLPKAAREALAACTVSGLPRLAGEQTSSDGTRKLLLELSDGQQIEAVCIPDKERRTLCISSQVGCTAGCSFCLTAQMGFKRNLTAGEILGQVFMAEALTDLASASYNIVFMGMGEPLLNRAQVEHALALLQDPEGMALSWRRITVSTSGLVGTLLEFARSPHCPRLAISLHSADDTMRTKLMPLNSSHPLSELRKILQELSRREQERISLEYILLLGINDRVKDAETLARFARGLKVKVNLIHFNPAKELPYQRSTDERARDFQDVLMDAGIPTRLRKSRGLDILAACGQLANAGWEGSAEGAAP